MLTTRGKDGVRPPRPDNRSMPALAGGTKTKSSQSVIAIDAAARDRIYIAYVR